MSAEDNHAIAVSEIACKVAARAVLKLGDRALSNVISLFDIECLFLRELNVLELAGLCCVFPNVRGWFSNRHSTIGDLSSILSVSTLFNGVPRSSALQVATIIGVF